MDSVEEARRLIAAMATVQAFSAAAIILLAVWLLLALVRSKAIVQRQILIIIASSGGWIALGSLCGMVAQRDLFPNLSRHFMIIGLVAGLYGITFLSITLGERVGSWFQGKQGNRENFVYRPWLLAGAMTIICSAILDSHFENNFRVNEPLIVGNMITWTFVLGYLRPDFLAEVTPRMARLPELVRGLTTRIRAALISIGWIGNLPTTLAEGADLDFFIPRAPSSSRIQLKLKRTRRRNIWGKIIFMLDARMEVSAEERHLIRTYRLGNEVIYDSLDRKRHMDDLQKHLDSTREQASIFDTPKAQFLGLIKTLFRFVRAVLSLARGSLALRITVRRLMNGVHVECRSMGELLGAEKAIAEAGENLRTYLDTAASFDGREEILEF